MGHVCGPSASTTRVPNGTSASTDSLNAAIPNGMPMIVRHSAMPAAMWARRRCQPSRAIRMLPMTDATPAPLATMTVRPKGHSE